jgi:very-short-patch-repair endonuclease
LAKFDFFVNEKYIIEFDGIQHFESVLFFKNNDYLTIKTRDDIKTQWCKENGIPLIRIPYTKLDTLTIEDLILDEEE